MSEWFIAQPSENVEITAAGDALWICGGKTLLDNEIVENLEAQTRLGKMLPVLLRQLLELDLATLEGKDVRIKHNQLAEFPDCGIDAFTDLFERSPFTLEVKTIGALGFASNRYNVNFYIGSERISPEVRGCLVKYEDKIYLLDKKSYELIAAADSFNESPAEEKTGGDGFKQFAEIKKLAAESASRTDRFMKNRRVLVPVEIGVELIEEEDQRISFAPKIEGVGNNVNFQAIVKRTGSAQPVYSFDGENGEKISVVLNDDQKEVINRIQNVRHLGGSEKTEVLRDPQAVFDGVMQAVNLNDFGPRVRGVGDFPFIVQPFVQRSVTGIFDGITREKDGSGESAKFNAGLQCRYADGSEQTIQFASPREVETFYNQVEEAFRSGKGQIEYRGKSIALDRQFVEGVNELNRKIQPKETSETNEKLPTGGKYLLIYTNEEEVEFEQSADESEVQLTLEIPASLRNKVILKDHQKKGVAWLQHNFRLKRQGCLLADDMGLGKTLQLLIFLAWLIERNDVVSDTNNPERPPWKPILIIAPLILIENETWITDMKKFFTGDGAVFMPWLTLRGAELTRMKRKSGQETKLGEAILDLDRLKEHRVVMTNYETIVNYQHSFAKMRDDWSVIITDEAQEYKTPNTKISHALKSLSPRFRVACTGTPVETKLFDVWNIFDFLQPGKLLGSAKDFRDKYEKPLEAVEETKSAIEDLKEKLHFGQMNAYILRRDKDRLPDLPKKNEHRLVCRLSADQRQYHENLLYRASLGGQGNHPFSLISDFLRVYQHPALVPQYNPQPPEQLIASCDKLQVLIEKLRDIRLRGEKALIFTRSLDMQQILVSVLNHRFNLSVNIINGSTKRSSGESFSEKSSGGGKTRRGIIKKFQESDGFNILILSPEVAGMGLTLTEANHVFHYGRWWNPAKEAQATDRVYRIGQEKDVHIYYLISKDPERKFETFDEKLDLLLQRRLALASDFLAPIPSEDDLRHEFLADLFGS